MTYEKLYLTALSGLQSGKISYPEYEQMIEPLKEEIKVPADGKKIEPLTDSEYRIFLAAMRREENICEKVDRGMTREPYEVPLVKTCSEIERKVKNALWKN